MSAPALDVVGIGNAIVDIIARCDDTLLARHQLSKGHMRLIDAAEVERLYADMGQAIETSGGSAANTIAGVASFGGKGAFIGKVADDEFGRIFRHDITTMGVTFANSPANGGLPTSRSLILVTPDGERTMNTFLGASTMLDEREVMAPVIESAHYTYLEGYLFDRPEAKRAFHRAAEIARAAGRKVALSLSDGFCVERHRAEFLDLIRGKVDLVLANTDEITSLYQSDFDEACARAARDARMAAITRSARGSLILSGGEAIEVPAEPVAHVVDTTGAGDLYAAGLLVGLSRGLPLAGCGRLASLAAAEAISHVGPRPEVSLAELAARRGLQLAA